MKNFLLCTLMAGLMMPAVAQEVWSVAGISKSFDRQTQGAVYPMTKLHDDGFIGCTWTTDDNDSFGGKWTRGIGYAYSTDGAKTWSAQEDRTGGIPLSFPSYAQWGAHGEAILGRSTESYEYVGIEILKGLVLLTREYKGVGEWTITPVPYPAGTSPDDGYTMAWARMATSGDNHQYIHIMSPMRLPEDQTYEGYYNPVFYYRTQTGNSWDIEGKLVPEMVGQEWEPHSEYLDQITFDTRGNVVACAFIAFGHDGYVLKSSDNGVTWTSIKFFDTPVGHYISPAQYADTCFIPTQGCIALDYNGDIHVAFSVVLATNSEEDGEIFYFPGVLSSFLSYWNENMAPLDGKYDFANDEIKPLLMEYFDWELSDEQQLYVKSTTPKWPIIGYFTPTMDEHYFTIDLETYSWKNCYGITGNFSFPQMGCDRHNTLYLVYLGLLDWEEDDSHLSHPFYTTRGEDGTWTPIEYLVNNINVIDQEFAYLTLAGIDDRGFYYRSPMLLMAQVDSYVGTYIGSNMGGGCQSIPSNNYFYHFHTAEYHLAINDIENPSLSLSVIPNPTSGQATVKFEGKGTITVYNMLGQKVYHIENVENEKIILLNNMASGVYFVTVRSGDETATQKLVVK